MFMKLEGRQVLVVGAGNVGEPKIGGLLETGARIRVVALQASPAVREWARDGKIELAIRAFSSDDLAGAFLSIVATNSRTLNERVYHEAQRRGVLCNVVDVPDLCDFFYPAVVRRGDLQIAVSTAGQSPSLAQKIRQQLEKQFDDLIEQQRKILVKNEFDRIYSGNGGSQMNAFTTEDLTAYFVNVPANKLELWMWMESERIFHPVFREFYAERDVVFEERRMRTESTPLGKFAEELNAMFWESSPYSWPVVGWPSDIPAISKAQADDFYGIYYSPQNITLLLIGDIKPDDAEALAKKYFERIPRGKKDPPDVVTMEVRQMAEKRMYAEAEANPQVDITWHSLPFKHRDSYALQILGQILSTRTGRLYKELVLGNGVATSAYARENPQKWAGSFNAGGEARDGHKPEEVEQGIYDAIERLKKEDVPPEELQKVKNNFAAGEYRRRSSNFPIMMNLIINDGYGDWHEVNEGAAKIQAVTVADVKRVANKYLTKENRTVAIYTRKAGSTKPEEKPLP